MPTQTTPPTVPPLTAPDALGAGGRAELVGQNLQQLQAQRFNLDIMQVANAAHDDDPVPGLALGPDGAITSYAKRRTELTESEQRVVEAFSDVMGEVRKLLETP